MAIIVSSLKESLQDILNKLISLSNVDTTPLFATGSVLMFNNQLLQMTKPYQGYDLLTPACLLELSPISNEDWLTNVSTTDYEVRFHILDTQLDAINGTLDQNLQVFNVRSLVKMFMTAYTPVNMGSLLYMGEKQDYKHTNLYHYILSFKTKYIDQTANPYENGTYLTKTAGNWNIAITEQFSTNLTGYGIDEGVIELNFHIG